MLIQANLIGCLCEHPIVGFRGFRTRWLRDNQDQSMRVEGDDSYSGQQDIPNLSKKTGMEIVQTSVEGGSQGL